jgi:hypothetical protein
MISGQTLYQEFDHICAHRPLLEDIASMQRHFRCLQHQGRELSQETHSEDFPHSRQILQFAAFFE